MQIVTDKITIDELKTMSEKMFDKLVKAVVDIEKEIMVVDAAMHADQEQLLLNEGSEQKNLWGFNLYPEHVHGEKWIVFDSMINIRPRDGNRDRTIKDPQIQEKIRKIVAKLVQK